jgi:hypothetical protein
VTAAECEIVADAGRKLKQVCEYLTVPASAAPSGLKSWGLLRIMDSSALQLAEVYGALSALPLEAEGAGEVA